MNLRQLQYVLEVSRNGLSVSKASRSLNTSQPGISQQIRGLEQELGLAIFTREKNRLTGLTPHGQAIVEHAEVALFNIDHITAVSKALTSRGRKELVIATTHTKARYLLPSVLKKFLAIHPNVSVSIRHGNPPQIIQDLISGEADIGLSPSIAHSVEEIAILPFHADRRILVVPIGHPLLDLEQVSLADIAQYPLITYERSIESHAVLTGTFASVGISPKIAIRAVDSGVIKTYVEQGLGIALLPEMAFDEEEDTKVRAIILKEAFPPSITCIFLLQNKKFSLHVLDFLKILMPRLTQIEILRLNAKESA